MKEAKEVKKMKGGKNKPAITERRPRSPNTIGRTFLSITLSSVLGSTFARVTSILGVVRSTRSSRCSSSTSLRTFTPRTPSVPRTIDGSISAFHNVTGDRLGRITQTRTTSINGIILGSHTGRKTWKKKIRRRFKQKKKSYLLHKVCHMHRTWTRCSKNNPQDKPGYYKE